jgi:Tol biopolymer transport system component
VWSPDGRYIAFFSGQDQQSGITLDVVNLSTGKQLTLVTNVASASTFSWAPDSKNIAFVAYDRPPPIMYQKSTWLMWMGDTHKN